MKALTLYELSGEFAEVLEALTDPAADIPMQAIADTLEGIEGMFNDKAVNVAKFIRNLEASAEAIKAAEEAMAKRRKAMESRAKGLRDYLKANMEKAAVSKIESPWFVLSIQGKSIITPCRTRPFRGRHHPIPSCGVWPFGFWR